VLGIDAVGLTSPIPATEEAGAVVDGDVDALTETNPVATCVGANNADEDASMATELELEIADDDDGEEEDNEDDEEDSGGGAEDCDERSNCCRCHDT
jgi:hypothetical protein